MDHLRAVLRWGPVAERPHRPAQDTSGRGIADMTLDTKEDTREYYRGGVLRKSPEDAGERIAGIADDIVERYGSGGTEAREEFIIRVRADDELMRRVAEDALEARAVSEISAAGRRKRAEVVSHQKETPAPAQSPGCGTTQPAHALPPRSEEHARHSAGLLSDYPLPITGQKVLKNATLDEIWQSVAWYETQSRAKGHRARWLRRVAEESTVARSGHIRLPSEDVLAGLWAEAEAEAA